MRLLLSIFLLTLFISCNQSPKTFDISESDWRIAKTAFSELGEALIKEDGKTWNYSLQGPLMLVNRETRAIIANEPDDAGKLTKREDLFTGKLPDNINIANTAIDWNGKRWTMVVLPLPAKKVDRLSLLIHESFHRIQPEIGFKSLSEIQSKHLDAKEGRVFLKLELEALKKALQSDAPDDHIKSALRFRNYRYQIFPDAKKAENSLEINEGLAEYTGSILCGRTDSDLKKHYQSQIDRLYTVPTFVRSFAYFTIPVYGYFMGKTDEKWNLSISNNTNLTDFLNNHWGIKLKELSDTEIASIGADYGMEDITKEENLRELKKIEVKNKYKAVFLSDSVLEIGLENMRIGFNPSNIMPLDAYGTVYPNLRITDNWGILKVDSCGALMSPDWKKVTVSFPTSLNDSLAIGKGWTLTLKNTYGIELEGSKYILKRK
jgi:hypothetical protein